MVAKDPKFGVDIFNPLGGMRFSWIVDILPFMEEQSLFDKCRPLQFNYFQESKPSRRLRLNLAVPEKKKKKKKK